jgi:Zn-dependent alcohol dehydrogenase
MVFLGDGWWAGLQFGLTDTLNSVGLNKPVEEVIRDMADGEGVDFSFDCTGNPGVIYSAMECANAVCCDREVPDLC